MLNDLSKPCWARSGDRADYSQAWALNPVLVIPNGKAQRHMGRPRVSSPEIVKRVAGMPLYWVLIRDWPLA